MGCDVLLLLERAKYDFDPVVAFAHAFIVCDRGLALPSAGDAGTNCASKAGLLALAEVCVPSVLRMGSPASVSARQGYRRKC